MKSPAFCHHRDMSMSARLTINFIVWQTVPRAPVDQFTVRLPRKGNIMSREIDVRDFSTSKVTPSRETELRSKALEVSDHLPGEHRIRIASFEPTTGNPAMVLSETAPAEK